MQTVPNKATRTCEFTAQNNWFRHCRQRKVTYCA